MLALFLQGDRLHRRGEARRLRVLRPDHHRRLDPVGGRAVDHRGRGRLPRAGAATTSSQALFVDLADLHGNTVDGVHVASTGGVWSARWSTASAACATTTAGCASTRGCPTAGTSLTFRITWRGTRVRVTLTASGCAFDVEAGELPVPVEVRGHDVRRLPRASAAGHRARRARPPDPRHARQPPADRRHPRRRQPDHRRRPRPDAGRRRSSTTPASCRSTHPRRRPPRAASSDRPLLRRSRRFQPLRRLTEVTRAPVRR